LTFETLQPAHQVGRTCCLYFDPIITQPQPQSLLNFEKQISKSTSPSINLCVVVEHTSTSRDAFKWNRGIRLCHFLIGQLLQGNYG
jgi:hypothetical protein